MWEHRSNVVRIDAPTRSKQRYVAPSAYSHESLIDSAEFVPSGIPVQPLATLTLLDEWRDKA